MRRIFNVILVIALVAGAWWLYNYSSDQAKKEPVKTAEAEGYTTAPVTRGSIEARVSATGSLAAKRAASVTLPGSGQVVEVLVKEGDVVQAGQPVAKLDARDLELALKQAQAALQVAEAQLARTKVGPTEADIAAAEANIASAKANLADLQKGPRKSAQELAKLAIDQAKNTLYGAQGNRDAIKGSPMSSGGAKTQAEAQVLNAEIGVTIAQIQYDQLFEAKDPSVIVNARAQITQAEASLAKLLAQPSPEDIAVAEAQVAQAKVNVELAAKRVNDATLLAPFTGRLVVWNLHVGDYVTPSAPVGTLLDDSVYRLEVKIDETEIGQVVEGQTARITLDAFPGKELAGKVSSIDALGENTSGIVNYTVTIELEPTDLPIKPLMTAAVDIVVGVKDNVLIVPNRALRRDKEGKYVQILKAGVPQRVGIETGVANETSTEVLKGLEEGQEVVVGRPRTNIFGGGF